MKIPEHYSLLEDNDSHFIIHDARDGQKIVVAKKGVHPAHQIKIMKLKKYAEGGMIKDPFLDVEKRLRAEPGGYDYKPPEEPTPAEATPDALPPETPGMNIAPPEVEASGMSQAPPMPQPQVMPQSMSQTVKMGGFPGTDIQGMAGQYQSAMNKMAQGQMEQNAQTAQVLEQNMPIMEQAMKRSQDLLMSYQQQADQLTADIASAKVDPQRYLRGLSSGQRLSSALGVLISGLGAGMSGQPGNNMAMNAINRLIDQDIEAQKIDLGKKQNLLSDNFRQQGNLMAAEAATRAQYDALIQGKLQLIAAKTNNPIIQAQAQQKALEFKLSMADKLDFLAKTQMQNFIMQKVANGVTYEQSLTLPPEVQKTLVMMPNGLMYGVGTADKAQTANEFQQRHMSIRNELQGLKQLVSQYGTMEMTGPAEQMMRQKIDSIAVDSAKMFDPQSVARPGEVENFRNMLFQPGSMFTRNKTAASGIEAYEKMLERRSQEQVKQLGIPTAPFKAPNDWVKEWLKANPNDKRAKKVQELLR